MHPYEISSVFIILWKANSIISIYWVSSVNMLPIVSEINVICDLSICSNFGAVRHLPTALSSTTATLCKVLLSVSNYLEFATTDAVTLEFNKFL